MLNETVSPTGCVALFVVVPPQGESLLVRLPQSGGLDNLKEHETVQEVWRHIRAVLTQHSGLFSGQLKAHYMLLSGRTIQSNTILTSLGSMATWVLKLCSTMLHYAPQGFLFIGIPQQSNDKSSFKCDELSV